MIYSFIPLALIGCAGMPTDKVVHNCNVQTVSQVNLSSEWIKPGVYRGRQAIERLLRSETSSVIRGISAQAMALDDPGTSPILIASPMLPDTSHRLVVEDSWNLSQNSPDWSIRRAAAPGSMVVRQTIWLGSVSRPCLAGSE
jgi:hypothetical protein